MRPVDWVVLLGTITLIIGWGLWKEHGARTADAYLGGERDLRWWTIGLSVMATQASAITFLSMPGQAYEDGLGFIQFYLGLPVAMVILSSVILPIYYRLKVYTAYEYLETRFDRRTRQLTAFLFLLSRGLASGISIYAPAIVLSTVLGWSLQLTNLIIGTVVIAYTVSGGTRVVSRTQTYQMVVMLGGMGAAAAVLWHQLPADLTLSHAAHLAGALGKMQAVDLSPRLDTRYTLWSGLTGGLFVQLAYFGTDQSQVQRYLGGASLTESRLGLLFNALLKVPMQFLILSIGVLLAVYYQFYRPPVFFDAPQWASMHTGAQAAAADQIETDWVQAFAAKRTQVDAYLASLSTETPEASDPSGRKAQLQAAAKTSEAIRARAKALLIQAKPGAAVKDADYIFIDFVIHHFPPGLVGLLIAVILCAAMSAVAAALNSLGSTTVVDFYRPSWNPGASDGHYLKAAKGFTILWGIVAVLFAAFASQIDNLIQAVNILGSIFYGPMLGVFLVGFFLPRVGGRAVFYAALFAQALVVGAYALSSIGFLWYNVIGCAGVVLASLAMQAIAPTPPKAAQV